MLQDSLTLPVRAACHQDLELAAQMTSKEGGLHACRNIWWSAQVESLLCSRGAMSIVDKLSQRLSLTTAVTSIT